MNGDTHNFYGVIFGTILITLISGFNAGFGKGAWFGLLTNILAMIVYGMATVIDNKHAQKEKTAKKDGNTVTHAISDQVLSKAKKRAFMMLYFNVFVVCLTASFDSTQWFGWNIATAAIATLLVICGAEIPDFDFRIIGVDGHRDPLTHSWLIATILWALVMVAFPVGDTNIIYISLFCVGYASHLMLDTIPSTATFFEGIKEFFAMHHSPGDIRNVPEKWEHPWLFFSSIALFIEFALGVTRFYGTHGFDYDVADWNPPSIAITVVGWTALALWIGLMISGRFAEKKKPSSKKQGYSKRYIANKESSSDSDLKNPQTDNDDKEVIKNKQPRKKSSTKSQVSQ